MSKISELSDGGALQSTDYLIAVRSGGNVKVQLSELPSGIGAGGNIVFGDNEKAIFGAGSDLQIYHDGSNSYIQDEGTGGLIISSNGAAVYIQKGLTETSAEFNTDGAVKLRYDNVTKFETTSTGIDVTGTVTADGLTVDGGATITHSGTPLALDRTGGATVQLDLKTGGVTNGYLGSDATGALVVYNNAAAEKMRVTNAGIDVTGTVTADGLTLQTSENIISWASGNGIIQAPANVYVRSTGTGDLIFQRDTATAAKKSMEIDGATGDISFYDSAGSSQSLFWDASAESLGIGTTSPTSYGAGYTTLEVAGSATGVFNIKSGSTVYGQMSTQADAYKVEAVGASTSLRFITNAAERARIDSSGNVGIGTAPGTFESGYHALQIGTTATFMGAGTGGEGNWISNNAVFNGGAWKYIQTASASSLDMQSSTAPFRFRYAASGTAGTAISWSEAMRIDSSGILSFSETSTASFPARSINAYNNGYTYITGGANGIVIKDASASGSRVQVNGATIQFEANGSERARIDSSGNLLVGTTSYNSNNTGHGISSAGTAYHTRSGAASLFLNRLGSNGDCLEFQRENVKVGSVSVSGTNATFNTSSDARLKHDIVDAPDASGLIDAIKVRSFKWNIDNSEQRYGMVAQELLEVAPEAVSGDPESDDMMGVDYSKLVPMLVKEIQSLRARVAQLEGA